MDVYEVTRARYKECVTAGVCSESGNLASIDLFYAYSDNPMASVDWDQSKTYCETWRGAHLPSEANGKRPRGTDGRTYPWGEEFDSAYVKIETGPPDNVGTYEKGKSPYGMYDMAGNVWEWVADSYDAAYYQTSPLSNPLGPDAGDHRVLRGGSWSDAIHFTRSTTRKSYFYYYYPDSIYSRFGFRCARDAQP